MKKGLYLYCLRKKNPALMKAVKTMGGGEVYTFPYEELEAVVSEVDLEEFASEEIQKKAQEDINWIKEKAQIHEHVIEQAMSLPACLSADKAGEAGVGGKIVPVIPMRFGTIFKTKKSLKEILKKNYLQLKSALEKLEGKQEWGVKVYLKEETFVKQLETNKAVLKKKKEIASLPKGMDFFAKKQAEEILERIKMEKLEEITDQIFENLKKFAVEANKGKNLAKEITGKKELMVLNTNFLMKEEKLGKFQKKVNELKAKYESLGLEICKSGPWPPYNFL